MTWSGAQAGEGIGHVSAVARPRRSITYEEEVRTEKKRRVVDGEGVPGYYARGLELGLLEGHCGARGRVAIPVNLS